jgi:hypothetical protein
VGDEVRKKVGQNAEQRQAANAVDGENPGAAAFMMFGGSRGLLGVGRRDRGPIFHAKTSRRKDRGAITLCVTPASRHGEAGQSGVILSRIEGLEEEKMGHSYRILRKLAVKMGKILPVPSFY